MPSGCFVVLEGPEGAGKTTLAGRLADRMSTSGILFTRVREPGGTPVAEALRAELLSVERQWQPETELLYMCTARADLVARIIRPALAAGQVVLSDRFDLSTMAYQGAGRGIPVEHVAWVNAAATGGLKPAFTLVLDIDPALGRERQQRSAKVADRMERENVEFHERVAAAYREASGTGVHHLDATASPEAVIESAWDVLVQGRPDIFRPMPEQGA